MRGRPGCPTGQKKNAVEATGGSPPLFYKERLGTGSPPHPTRLRRPTYGLWWLRLDLTEQSPGLFDPQGEGFGGGRAPSCMRNHLPQPAQPVGGPLRA